MIDELLQKIINGKKVDLKWGEVNKFEHVALRTKHDVYGFLKSLTVKDTYVVLSNVTAETSLNGRCGIEGTLAGYIKTAERSKFPYIWTRKMKQHEDKRLTDCPEWKYSGFSKGCPKYYVFEKVPVFYSLGEQRWKI